MNRNKIIPYDSSEDANTNTVATAIPVVSQPIPIASVVQSVPMRPNIPGRSPSTRLLQQNESSDALYDARDRFLASHGYTRGLRIEIIRTLREYPSRIWVLDNSGSMSTNDGSLYVLDKKRQLSCTRWVELQDTIKFHLDLAAGLQASCDLQLLNPGHEGEQFMSCSSSNPRQFQQQVAATWRTIKLSYPHTRTPLSEHIHQIHRRILPEAASLRAKGERICIILATDGLPSDNPNNIRGGAKESFRQALNSLHGLPVWVVVRLLTDEDDVVEYYNDLDQQVELPLEVLDDWKGEAREVHACNPWMNYTKQLHHAREMGMRHPVLDLMDEKPLGPSQVIQFVGLLFGEDVALELPHPGADMDGFMASLKSQLDATKPQFNVITKKIAPLINLGRLKSHLKRSMGGGGGCVIL